MVLVSNARLARLGARLDRILVHSSDRAPSCAMRDLRDGVQADAVLSSECSQSNALCPSGSNLADVVGGQFCIWARFPLRRVAAPLLMAVGVVVLRSTGKQVRGVAARPIVTSVQRARLIRRQFAIRQNVGNDMGQLTILTVDDRVESAISIDAVRRPGPASIRAARTINLVPEAIREGLTGLGDAGDVTGAGAGLPPLPDVGLICSELVRTRLAHQGNGRGRLVAHRDFPLSRNRGAGPRSVDAGSGAFCCNYTINEQIGRAA